jgi:ABC-type multidrug transport system permease subunit
MYRVSPFTYWIGGIAATELHGRAVVCSASETSVFDPPAGRTCAEYLKSYLQTAPGQLQNPNDTSSCRYCSLSVADQYMAGSSIFWSERWRNHGIMWAYIAFNIFIAVLTYYVFRVPKSKSGLFHAKRDKEGV